MKLLDKAKARYARTRAFWLHEIWEDTPDDNFAQRFALNVSRTLYIVVAGFLRERIKLRAAALTYVTLLSIIPAIVVGFSLFAAFGGLEDNEARLKSFIVDTIAVRSQREAIFGFLDQFLQKGTVAKLGTIGTLPLLLTVVSLLSNIELSFNDIWGVQKSRSFLQRFQVYWPLITLAPILLGVSLSLSTAFEASDLGQRIYEVPGMGLVFGLVSILLTCLFFTLLYQIMPNTRVHVKHALVGGLVAGVLWVIAQKLYGVYAANAITYSALYGSLGAVPLFIIWVYVSWIVTLLGAMLTFAVQSAKTYEPERPIAFRDREFVAVRLMVSAASRFEGGQTAVRAQELIDEVAVPPRLARQLLGMLVRHGLLAETTAEEDDVGYVPARPIERISVAEVVRALREDRDIERLEVPEADRLGLQVARRLRDADDDGERSLLETTLADLIAPGEGDDDEKVHALRDAKGG